MKLVVKTWYQTGDQNQNYETLRVPYEINHDRLFAVSTKSYR